MPDEPDFELTIAAAGDQTVVSVAGEMDLATADAFAAAVREQLARGPVVVDLGALVFMDSSGVRVLDALLGDVDRERWTLTIRPDLHENVRQVLTMTAMIDILPLAPGPTAEDR